MNVASDSWEQRLADVWTSLPGQEPEHFRRKVQALVAELPNDAAIGLFELACAQDSTGHSDLAVPLYRSALSAGLSGLRRRRATIQLASSMRNVGQAQQAVVLLEAEASHPRDELSGAVSAFLALALSEIGRDREALGHALSALSTYLPRYNASLGRYAAELLVTTRTEPSA